LTKFDKISGTSEVSGSFSSWICRPVTTPRTGKGAATHRSLGI